MSLLVAEAATNAMKYVGTLGVKKPWISLSFKTDAENKMCQLEMVNSIGPARDVESTGLGAKLISAFGIQLGAKVEIEETEDTYKMTVAFEAAAFEPESTDF